MDKLNLRRITSYVFVAVLLRSQSSNWSVFRIKNFQSESPSMGIGEVPGDIEIGARFQFGSHITWNWINN